MKKIKAYLTGKHKVSPWFLILMFGSPIADYYLMEAYYMNPFKETRVPAQLLNILLFELIMLALFFGIGHLSIALQIETVFFCVVGLLDYAVISFRNMPLVPWDIFSVRTGASVVSNYSLEIGPRQIFTTIAFIALFLLQFTVNWTPFYPAKKRWPVRVIGCVAAVFVFLIFAKLVQTDKYVEKWNLYPFLFTPTIMAQRNGFFLTYVMDHQYVIISPPDGYQKETVEEMLSGLPGEDALPEEKPTIIAIMDEAFSDLTVLGDLKTNEDAIPFLRSMMEGGENAVTGTLHVSVKGGNTANSEFELLTGNSMAFLPIGSIPYQQYIKHDLPSALPRYLGSLGYTSTAIHPYRPGGWDRNKVYPRLGFDRMIFQDEFRDPEYLRDYISDKSSFDKIIEVYEEGKDKGPQFIFNVTMQNHGGYGDAFPNFEEEIRAENVKDERLDRYLSLMRVSDRELQRLTEYFEAQEEPVILLFFGDHQPNDTVAGPVLSANGKDARSLTAREEDIRYTVPYLIWANFDIEEKSEADTSVNYLGGHLLETAGLPLSDYQRFLKEEETAFPVLSAERAEKADGSVEEPMDCMGELTDYRMVQYYELYDAEE